MDPHSIDSASAEATLGWDGPGDIATVEHETLDSAKSLFPSILSYYAWRDQIAELHERILLQDVASTRALLGRIIQLINDPLILSFDPSSAQRIELLSAASLCRASFGFLRQHYELPNCYDALKEELGGNPGAWKHRRKAKFDRISNSLSLTKRVLDIELSLTKLLTLRILGCDAEEEQASRQEIVNLARLTESESDVDPSQREFYERIAENFKYIPRDAAHYDALKHLVDVLESSEFEGLFDTVPEAMQTATQQTEALSSGGILATIVAIVTFGWLRKSQQ